MTDLPAYVLVKGAVVYKLIRPERVGRDYRYRRWSVPPDATPGMASKFRPGYAPHKLPEHEVIGEDEAKRIQASRAQEFKDRLIAMAKETSA